MFGTGLPISDVRRCASDPQFLQAVEDCYAALDAAIAERRPVCTNRGACCRFGEFGHNLFVTSVEFAYFLSGVEASFQPPPDRSFCPWQQGGQCTARVVRPAGCRIFFCDPNAQHWQPDQTEAILKQLQTIGDRFDLPYAYMEWTDALRQWRQEGGPKPLETRSADSD